MWFLLNVTKQIILFLALLFFSITLVNAAPVPTIKQMNEILRSLSPDEKNQDMSVPNIDLNIVFKINSAVLTEQAKQQIDELAKAMLALFYQPSQYSHFQIAGHTDASGSAKHNKNLSLIRAKAVKRYLNQQYNLEQKGIKMTTMGWGEEQLKNTLLPMADENRRVEISILPPEKTHEDPNSFFLK